MCAKRLQAKNPNLLRGLGVWKLTWKYYVQPQHSLGTSQLSVQSYTWALNTTIAMLGIGTCYVSHPTPTGILRTWFQKEKLQVTKGQMPHKRVWKEEKGSLLDCCNRSYSVNNGHRDRAPPVCSGSATVCCSHSLPFKYATPPMQTTKAL